MAADQPPIRDEAAPASGFFHLIATRPVAVTMTVVAICVFGVVSLQKLPVTLLPEMSFPTLTIRTEYPGAAPAEVEELLTEPIEENVAVVSNLTGYRSVSRAGGCDVILEFAWATPMTFAVQEVREKLDQLMARLPRGVERPLVLRYDPTFDPILRIGVFGGGDLYRLRAYAVDELKRKLETTPGVAAVKVKGGFEKEIRVELSEASLRQRRVSLATINQRLGAENVNVASGILRDGDVEYVVRTLNEFQTPEDIGRMVVAMEGTHPVRLAELGTVTPSRKERDAITRIDGSESVEIEIYKEADANLVAVAQAVKARLFGAEWRTATRDGEWAASDPVAPRGDGVDALAASVPPGTRLKLLTDPSVFIEQSLAEVRRNAIEGAVLAVLVLYAFLRRYKPTLIIAVAIPVSILATFGPLYLHGVSLNVMSLGGLAIGVGMLVDNSIVVLEAIERRRELGDGAFLAAVNGTREMALAVTATTLTTIIVFLPIVFVDGVAGQMFRDQALAVVYSLVASMVAAMVLVPMLSALRRRDGPRPIARATAIRESLSLLPHTPSHPYGLHALGRIARGLKSSALSLLWTIPLAAFQIPFELAGKLLYAAGIVVVVAAEWGILVAGKLVGWIAWPFLRVFDGAFNAFQTIVAAALRGALKARLLTIVAAAALSYLAVIEITKLKQDLVPPLRQGLFTIETQFDVGTPVEETDARGQEISARVRAALDAAGIPVESTSLQCGVARDAIAKPGDGSHTAKLFVQLRPQSKLKLVEDRARAVARDAIAAMSGAGTPVISAPSLFQTRTAIEAEIVGTDRERLVRAAVLLERDVAVVPGMASVRSTVRRGRPEIVIRFDRDALARYDLRLSDLAQTIQNKVQGVVATRFAERERRIDVRTKIADTDLATVAALQALQVNPGSTPPIPLHAVAAIDVSDGPAEIRHVGGRRAETVSAELAGLDLRGAGVAIATRAEALRKAHPEVFESVVVRLAGQNEEAARSMDALYFALALAGFLVYLLMAAQFESLVHPLVIMFTIPLALIGVVFVMRAMDISISVVVFIGAILLVGVVVDNAIILIDSVNQLRRGGMTRDLALMEASRVRLRPIAMTTGTTVLGLLPLALGIGEGAELRQPMAIVVIAGLTASTLLTLVVIPVVYAVMTRPGALAKEPA